MSYAFATNVHMMSQERHFESPFPALDAIPAIEGHLYSIAMPVVGVDALRFLGAGQEGLRFYWAEPDSQGIPGVKLAGSGVAAELMTMPLLGSAVSEGANDPNRFQNMRRQAMALFADSQCRVMTNIGGLESLPMAYGHPARPRLFGGFAFSPEFVPDNTWSVFQPAHFVLPHFQLVESDGVQWLTINALLSPDEPSESAEMSMIEALMTGYEVLCGRLATPNEHTKVEPSSLRSHSEIRYPMSSAQWERMVTQATESILDGHLEKVVLSRVGEVRLDHSIDAVSMLRRLSENYSDCYRFLFEPLEGHAFVGATPELLIDLDGDVFNTVALAGSIGRGHTLTEDDQLAEQLMASAKDRHEHDVVVNELQARLSTVSDTLTVLPEPEIQRLRNIQHLRTPLNGRVTNRQQVDVLTLTQLLHPTPALGGMPASGALRFLTEMEPVPRGWYAAPVGWIDSQLNGAFAVAIRSAVCWRERAWLYAGAGIVGDSQPDKEWAETELKFRPMLTALLDQG